MITGLFFGKLLQARSCLPKAYNGETAEAAEVGFLQAGCPCYHLINSFKAISRSACVPKWSYSANHPQMSSTNTRHTLDTGSGWIVKSDDAMRNGFLNLFTDNSLTCQLPDNQLADTTSRRHSKLLTSKISAESLQNVQGHINWGHTRPHLNPYPDPNPNPKALTLSLNPKP